MDPIVLGAYATEADAEAAKVLRQEPQIDLSVIEDNVDAEHPWRIYWTRT